MKLLGGRNLFGDFTAIVIAVVFLSTHKVAAADPVAHSLDKNYSQLSQEADAESDDEAPHGRFYERKGEGWFWYQDPKDKLKPKKVPPKVVEEKKAEKEDRRPPEKREEPFSVEWLRSNLPKLLDKAINDPTDENVKAYMYAQKVAMDKSQRYSEKVRLVVAGDPFLDENNRVPLATFAKQSFLKAASVYSDDAMRYLSGKSGLWVFFDSSCAFCKAQIESVSYIQKQFGFVTKYISLDGRGLPNTPEFAKDNGVSKVLDIKVAPTTVLVVPPNNYYVVSQGMMAADQLQERILLAAQSQNLLPPEMIEKLNAYDKNVLTSEEMKDGAGSDPAEMIKRLQEKLRGKQK